MVRIPCMDITSLCGILGKVPLTISIVILNYRDGYFTFNNGLANRRRSISCRHCFIQRMFKQEH